ncbi:hypothetical protein NQ315_002979, partial [Exocentrus adspersus]
NKYISPQKLKYWSVTTQPLNQVETANFNDSKKFNMKFFSLFFIVVFALVALQQTVSACIADRNGCQPDGRQGNCCSGFCHKEPGWVAGYCKRR